MDARLVLWRPEDTLEPALRLPKIGDMVARVVHHLHTKIPLARPLGPEAALGFGHWRSLPLVPLGSVPNFMPWAGYMTPFVYRFRPNGKDAESCVIDFMLLEPVPEGGARAASRANKIPQL